MADKKKNLRWRRKTFRKALKMELREHKSSFIVFYVLRLLVIVTLVRQITLQNYESVFLCALTLLLLYVPSFVQVKLRIELPPLFEISVLCLIFATEILGEINAFFVVIPLWDAILHTLNGFLAAAVGFSQVAVLNKSEKRAFDLSPFFMAVVAFCFAMTIGTFWEFFEFGMDTFFHTDMQKDAVVHAIYSVALDPTKSNKVVTIPGITDAAVNGKSLGLGGYLDIGLIDTMKDLFVNFIGATVFAVIGFFYARSKGKAKSPAVDFVPILKPEDKDFLKKARTQDGKNEQNE